MRLNPNKQGGYGEREKGGSACTVAAAGEQTPHGGTGWSVKGMRRGTLLTWMPKPQTPARGNWSQAPMILHH